MYKLILGSLFASLILAACGGGSGDDGGDGGTPPADDLGFVELTSTDDVAVFGASLLSVAQSPPIPEIPETSESSKAYKTVESCDTSGMVETFDTRSESVDSPFTDSLFNIESSEYRDCIASFESADFSFSSSIDGYEESGTPADGTDSGIDYVGFGTAEDLPFTLSTNTTQGSVTESSNLSFFGVIHTQSQDDEHVSSQVYLRGEIESHGSPAGDYHNRILLGESMDGALFVSSVVPAETVGLSETTLDGLIGSEDLLNDSCPSGMVQISTVSPLIAEDESGELRGGELQLDAGDDVAGIVYNEDQSITVTLNGGSPVTYTLEDLEALDAECLTASESGT
ncbi:hypothetical protein RM530_04745 [Algiphilus sp. W345]|uniref:Lipoprotein n=1 Tax=Banduia mediterranea TaxID=3075609 RepID=A0ABU2WFM2_9GAMM|nr:hypothetical protein [Algiphilus sp. W345]MDT0496669.1 hypothetical protein [Algiphilus sp. W345]